MKLDNKIIPRRAWFRHKPRKHERLEFFLLGLGTLWEGLVITFSLGYLTVDTRAWLLFDVFEDD